MSRPGDFVRRTAIRVCSERMRRRLIDPAVADLQAEIADARRSGSTWRALRALSAGYVSLAKVLVIAIAGDLRVTMSAWNQDEAARTRRGVWVALGTTLAATAVLEVPFFAMMTSDISIGGRLRMAAYLTPQALAFSLPLGLAVAFGWLLHGRARTPKVAGAALLAAVLTSAAMFVNLGWVTPDANQAFREGAMARYGSSAPAPPRGDGELRFGELRAALEQARAAGRTDDARHLETLYYRKWSVSVTPFTIVALIIALAFWRQWTRTALTGTAIAMFVANYAFLMFAFPLTESGLARPIVIEWAGNAVFAAVALAVTCSRWLARRPA